ncbi:MAG: SulP family inorganic anion transporter [Acidimicrobiia bacterium]
MSGSAPEIETAGAPAGWLFSSLRGYRPEWWRSDLIAGLTVWAVLVPEALAYATIAGVSPVIGLYAAPPALILYAAFGSSKHLVTGPMAATAALSAAAVADVATDENFVAFTAILAVLTGLIALLAGLLKLGFVANFISEPVLKGFIIGLALTIIVGQLPKFFGIEGGEGNFFEKLWAWIKGLGETDVPTLVVGLISLAIVLVLRAYWPAIPGPLVAVVFGIGAVVLLDLAERGVAIVGDIESGLPALGLPDGSAGDYLSLAPAAVGVMLVGFAEGLGAGKTYASRHHYEIDANRELIGLGAANLGSGLSGGMVVNGSLSKTAVNGTAGARTQVSGLVVAVLTILTLLFLTGLFADLPEATLAAVVIAAIVELVDIDSLKELYHTYTERLGRIYGVAARPDFIAATAAMLGVLIFDTLPGLFIGIGMSLFLMVFRSSKPNIARLGLVPGTDVFADTDRRPEAVEPSGVRVVRVESGLFFGNAEYVRGRIRSMAGDSGVRAVVVDAETIPFVDVTAVRMLTELAEELEREKVTLAIAHGIGQVRDLIPTDGGEHGPAVYRTLDEALAALARPEG